MGGHTLGVGHLGEVEKRGVSESRERWSGDLRSGRGGVAKVGGREGESRLSRRETEMPRSYLKHETEAGGGKGESQDARWSHRDAEIKFRI